MDNNYKKNLITVAKYHFEELQKVVNILSDDDIDQWHDTYRAIRILDEELGFATLEFEPDPTY